ncbi:MAG: hypothetical protein GY802_21340, partial [Gammaproteobacteria bacterium]|nr:hypothetical protein [Gammaproteobacteria bacterium]
MRYTIILISALLLFGCSSKSAQETEAEVITKIGVISAKEDVNMEQVEKDTGARTSVYGSISTGGRVSIGLGFLLGSFSSGSSDPEPVRYEVNLIDGGQMTIYHDSHDFEVDDCVKITVHPDEKKHPPT